MTTGTKNMLKRCAAIMTALFLLVAFVPEIKTEASATGALPVPVLPPMIPGVMPSGYMSEDIGSLYVTLSALLRTAGVQIVDANGSFEDIKTTTAAYMVATVYNAMSEAEKAAIWAQSQAVAAGGKVIEFADSIIASAKSYFSAGNPTVSTGVIDGTTYTVTSGMTFLEYVYSNVKSGTFNMYYNMQKWVETVNYVMFPLQPDIARPGKTAFFVYAPKTGQPVNHGTLEDIETTSVINYGYVVLLDYQGKHLHMGMYLYLKSSGEYVIHIHKSEFNRLRDGYLMSPPTTYKDECPITYPSVTQFVIPDSIGAVPTNTAGIENAMIAINAMPAEQVWIPPVEEPAWGDFPDVLPDALDFLTEKMQGIGALELVWRQFLELDALIEDIYGRMTPDDIDQTMDVILGINEWARDGSKPGVWPDVPSIADVVAQEIERLEIKYLDPEPDPDPNPEPAGIFAMFPFCIPWDVMAFFEALAAPPVEPRFEVDIFGGLYGDAGTIVIEFSRFENIRILVRNCILIVLIVGLMFATKQYIWTGGG